MVGESETSFYDIVKSMNQSIIHLNREHPVLALIVPCYNEEEMIGLTMNKLQQLLDKLVAAEKIDSASFVLFIDDGSTDNTLPMIRQNRSNQVNALKLSANVGHQHALIAGLHYVAARCDCAISLDADLQDDLSIIPDMLSDFRKGAHLVYGIRDGRKTDSAFKRNTAQFYYTLMRQMGVNLIHNHADFRLTSKTVLQELVRYKEVNLFLRGLFPKMGFTATYLYYNRQTRTAGVSKYPFRKMLALAINGITSFTNLPLKIITWIGFVVFIVSIVLSAWVLVVTINGSAIPGWASITLPVYFIGGIQLLALGVIGEYIGKIYMETKQRPRYHIEEFIGSARLQTIIPHAALQELDVLK